MYRVRAPYVTLKVKDPAGNPVIKGFYAGALVPESADEANVRSLVDGEMLEEVADLATEPEVEAETPVFERPAGNASQEAWATYALESRQASEDEVKGLTRDELRELYG